MKLDPKTNLFTELSLEDAQQMVAWAHWALDTEDDGVFDRHGKFRKTRLDRTWVGMWSTHADLCYTDKLEISAGPRSDRGFVARVMLSVLTNYPVTELSEENARLRAWVDDLQSKMYINCVYCGHRYGPDADTPTSMADVLTAHVEVCPKHPLSAARARISELEAQLGIK